MNELVKLSHYFSLSKGGCRRISERERTVKVHSYDAEEDPLAKRSRFLALQIPLSAQNGLDYVTSHWAPKFVIFSRLDAIFLRCSLHPFNIFSLTDFRTHFSSFCNCRFFVTAFFRIRITCKIHHFKSCFRNPSLWVIFGLLLLLLSPTSCRLTSWFSNYCSLKRWSSF